jgi:hypothetical protein
LAFITSHSGVAVGLPPVLVTRLGQRVDLDDGDDPQVRVRRVGEDRGDRVDVLGLVPRQVVRPELAVGGQRRAVAAGQVVDDELDHERLAAGLLDRGVEVVSQAHAAAGPVDGRDPVQPNASWLVGDPAATRLGGGLRGPLGIHVDPGAGVRVVDPGRRRRGHRGVDDEERHRREYDGGGQGAKHAFPRHAPCDGRTHDELLCPLASGRIWERSQDPTVTVQTGHVKPVRTKQARTSYGP